MRLLTGLLRPSLAKPASRPLPGRPLAVVGDLHGRADLLEELVAEIAGRGGTDRTLVFVGDHVDRGEDSAGVLRLLLALQGGGWPAGVICLKGNHEAMMLGFLDAPEEAGPGWLRHGGAQTLASFGIRPPDPGSAPALTEARDALQSALPAGTEAWLRALPASHRSGNLLVAHAGANPHAAAEAQTEEDLLWGHPEFLDTPRDDGLWVAHGHTICAQPSAAAGRIAVDTGAYATHRLTAALICDETCRFLSTREGGGG